MPRSKAVLWSVAAGALGAAINLFPVTLFSGVVLYVGGAVNLAAGIMLGPLYGLVAAIITLAGTKSTAPWVVVLFPLEALVVAWAVRRHSIRPVFAEFAGRGCALIPWSITVARLGLATFNPEVWVSVLRVMLNGVILGIIAELIVSITIVRGTRYRKFQEYLVYNFILVAVIPLLVLTIFYERAYTEKLNLEAASRLEEAAIAIRQEANDHLETYYRALLALADRLSHTPLTEHDALPILVKERSIYDGFMGIVLIAPSGNVTAWDPERLQTNLKDRDYFQKPLTTGQPFVTEIRASGPRPVTGETFPILVVSAPVFSADGTVRAILAGSLDLNKFKNFGRDYATIRRGSIIILDQHDRVIYSSAPSYSVLQPLVASPLVQSSIRAHGQAFYYNEHERSGSSTRQLAVSTVAPKNSWRIIVQQPVAEINRDVNRYFLTSMLLVLTAIAFSALVAHLLTKKLTRPIDALVSKVREFKLHGRPEASAELPRRGPAEIVELTKDFDALSQRLNESYEELQEAIRSRDGANRELQSVLTDLDGKVKVRTMELDAAKARAEAASRAKSEFIANVSHEIRTPMNGIVGMTDVLMDTQVSDDQMECLSAIKTSSTTLLSIINDILDFSKIEAGKIDIADEPFQLRHMVRDFVQSMSVSAKAKGLRLSARIDDDVPVTVRGDSLRLRQVLTNLVGNALKFTEQGQVAIGIQTKQRDGDQVELFFFVSDTGIGIPKDKKDIIFEAFSQADGSTTRKFGGTGLGLTISARLVELMQGRIWVESEENSGSTFYFTVRLQVAQAEASRLDVEKAATRSTPKKSVNEPLHILLAEDNPVNQKLALRLLQKRGHTVELVTNGREAVAAVSQRSFDLVLMDVQMPQMGGLEATAMIRSLESGTDLHLPIIAMTAHAMTGDRERCIAVGMDDYISKPVEAKALYAALEKFGARPIDARMPTF